MPSSAPGSTSPHHDEGRPAATARVLVLGSANMDLVAGCETLPRAGETVIARDFATVPGGKGANQAIAAARSAMAGCVFLGAVGADQHGARLREVLRADGVDVSLLREVSGVSTGTALIAVDASGMNSIVVVAGANATLHALSAAELGAVRDSAVVLAQLEIPPDTVRAAFEAAHEGRERSGQPPGFTILNAAPARPVDRSLLAATDLLVVNETEAATLTGSRADAGWSLCARLLESAPRVVVTVGSGGVLFADRAGTRQHIPAAPARPVDTTAAGDTFTGVLAAAIAADRPAVTALRLACAAASVTVEKAGAIPSIPTAAQTAERYQAAYTRGRPAGHDDGEAGDGR